MDGADRREVIVRTSRGRTIGGTLAVALGVLIFGAWDLQHGSDTKPWVYFAIAGFFTASGLYGLRDISPRLILAHEGLAWRGRRKAPLDHLPWSEISKAEIVNGGEDDPRSLRLTLARPALEVVASERKPKVDIDIDAIDLNDNRLRRAINGFAPHLFAGAA